MKVKSVSFYQSVKLGDGGQHNTVYLPTEGTTDNKYRGVEMHFKNGMMAIKGTECASWKPANKEKVYFAGLTNIRGFEAEMSELKGTPFAFMMNKVEGPTRTEMMDFLREKEIKFAGNIKNVDLVKLFNDNLEE